MSSRITPILLGIGVFAIDQGLKFFAYTRPNLSWYVFKPWLGWEYFPNPGIAFGLPVPNELVIAITPVLVFLISLWWLRQPGPKNWLAASLVWAGALSNFSDRFRLAVTVDYLRIFYSVINVADIAIVLGLLWLLYSKERASSPIT